MIRMLNFLITARKNWLAHVSDLGAAEQVDLRPGGLVAWGRGGRPRNVATRVDDPVT